MRNLITEIKKFIQSYESRAIVEIPPKIEFGHLSSNIPIFLTKDKLNEMILNLKNEFSKEVVKCEILGTFLNIFLSGNVLKNQIMQYTTNNSEKFIIEFVSPNPTGPMHIGHARNSIIGNATYNMMKLCGFNISSENYINDQGNQMNQFLDTIRHYKNPDKYKEIYYKGEYVKDIANQVNDYVIKEDVLRVILSGINATLAKMFIKFDNVVFESSLHEQVHFIINKLDEMGLIEKGTMENQKTDGDLLMVKHENERFVLQKANGDFTYFAFDLAYFYDKFLRLEKSRNPLIVVLAEDHYAHIKKMSSILNKLGINIKVIKYSMVYLIKDNKIMNMSKREGTIITINDMLKDITIQDLTAEMMRQNFNKVLNISLDKKIEQNEMFYVQYVYNRINNILIKFPDDYNDETISIDSPYKNTLFALLMHYASVLENAVNDFDSHKIFDFSMKVIRAAYDYLIHSSDFHENIILLLKTYSVILNMDRIFSLNFIFESKNEIFEDNLEDIINEFKEKKFIDEKQYDD